MLFYDPISYILNDNNSGFLNNKYLVNVTSLINGTFSQSLVNGYVCFQKTLLRQNSPNKQVYFDNLSSLPSLTINPNPASSSRKRNFANMHSSPPMNNDQLNNGCISLSTSPTTTISQTLKKPKIDNPNMDSSTNQKKLESRTAQKRFRDRKKQELENLREGHNSLLQLNSTADKLTQNYCQVFPNSSLKSFTSLKTKDPIEKIDKTFSIITQESTDFKKNSEKKRKRWRLEINRLEEENKKMNEKIAKLAKLDDFRTNHNLLE
jgi:hypothetical protein